MGRIAAIASLSCPRPRRVLARLFAAILCRIWRKNYQRLPDAIILEGPRAGGHLGFTVEELENPRPLEERRQVQERLRQYAALAQHQADE